MKKRIFKKAKVALITSKKIVVKKMKILKVAKKLKISAVSNASGFMSKTSKIIGQKVSASLEFTASTEIQANLCIHPKASMEVAEKVIVEQKGSLVAQKNKVIEIVEVIKEVVVELRQIIIEIRQLEGKGQLTSDEKVKIADKRKKFKQVKRKFIAKKVQASKARKSLKKARSKVVKKMNVLKLASKMSVAGAKEKMQNKSVEDVTVIIKDTVTQSYSSSELEAQLLLNPKGSIKKASRTLVIAKKALVVQRKLIIRIQVVIKTIVIEVTKITTILKTFEAKGQLSTQDKAKVVANKKRLRILRPKLAKKKIMINKAKVSFRSAKRKVVQKMKLFKIARKIKVKVGKSIKKVIKKTKRVIKHKITVKKGGPKPKKAY